MGEQLLRFFSQLPLETNESGTNPENNAVCMIIIILCIVLVALYAGLFIYSRMIVGRKAKQHPCKYCGHMVNAVSQCCGAPVEEKFMAGKCSNCGRQTRTVCATCKRELY